MLANDKTYDQLWKIYCEIRNFESHFSNAQIRFRALTATFFLAAFAATGFVLSNEIGGLPKELAIGTIGLSASVGVSLLWIIDLMFYQRLLDAAYIEGRSLEETQDWLPQVRNKMRILLGGEGLALLVWFYMIGTLAMGLLGGIGLGAWIAQRAPIKYFVPGALAYFTMLIIVVLVIRKKTSTTARLEKRLVKKRVLAYENYEIINTSDSIEHSSDQDVELTQESR